MNDTENLRKFGEDFDLQDSERPHGGDDEEGQRQLDQILSRPAHSAIGKFSNLRRYNENGE